MTIAALITATTARFPAELFAFGGSPSKEILDAAKTLSETIPATIIYRASREIFDAGTTPDNEPPMDDEPTSPTCGM